MFVVGHGANTITRSPSRSEELRTDLLVVCDPYPHLGGALGPQKWDYLLPACTSFEMNGSRTASNRSLQWARANRQAGVRIENDYDTMYMLARKLGFAGADVQELKVENGAVSGGRHPAAR